MVLDASAIIGIVLQEPGCELLEQRVAGAAIVAVGAPTLVEAAMVLASRLKGDARPVLNRFLESAEIEVIPFTQDHYDVAVDAFRRFGKGRHPAGLNFGDCLAYAVARVAGMPLLFSGNDFSKTDIAALP